MAPSLHKDNTSNVDLTFTPSCKLPNMATRACICTATINGRHPREATMCMEYVCQLPLVLPGHNNKEWLHQ